MKNKNLPIDKHGNGLDFLFKCSFCGSALEKSNLMVIEEQEQKTVFHISCPHCEVALISVLSGNQSGIVGLGIATDLDKEEVKNKFFREIVSADEVIEAHEFIEGKQGNFMQLIKNLK
jgi:hypothetical protein